MTKSVLFIGSSSEGLPFARAIRDELSKEVEVKMWDEAFLPGDLFLDRIRTFPYQSDFAILVLTPDDLVESRKTRAASPRDNVLFELGVFMSALGREKTFVVCTSKKLKLPSDLAGLTVAFVDERENRSLPSRVRGPCNQICTALKEAKRKSSPGLLPSTTLAVGYFRDFVDKVCSLLSDRNTVLKVGERRQSLNVWKEQCLFVVVVPDSFRYIGVEEMRELRSRYPHIEDVTLSSSFRDFPMYALARPDGNVVELFDIPSTLATSAAVIDYVFGRKIGGDELRDLLRQRELVNFRVTLERLVENKIYRERVAIRDMSYLGREAQSPKEL